MANKACLTRLQKEYRGLQKEPVPHISAHPTPTNLLEWHFVLEGDKDTEYAGGVYHGKIVFPPQYPFKPPSISLYTPNGRFAVNTKLCLSMTDYHPESWNPMWSVGTILTGLLSFMHDNQPTTGSINTSVEEKKRLAAESLAYNLKNPMFKKLFPEWVEAAQRQTSVSQQPTTTTSVKPTSDNTQGHIQPATTQTQPTTPQQHQQQTGTPNQPSTAGQPARHAKGRSGSVSASSVASAAVSGLWTVAAVVVVAALVAVPLMSLTSSARFSV